MLPPSLATPEVDTLLELSKSMVKYHSNKTSTKEMQKKMRQKKKHVSKVDANHANQSS